MMMRVVMVEMSVVVRIVGLEKVAMSMVVVRLDD